MPRYADRFNFYCEGCSQDGSIKLIPLKRWLTENFYTRDQVKTLLRKRVIVAKKFKGRLYVASNPHQISSDSPL